MDKGKINDVKENRFNEYDDKDLNMRFRYSLAVAFGGLGGILGIANLISTRYLSRNLRMGVIMFFFVGSIGLSGLLLSILTRGLSLTAEMKQHETKLRFYSRKFFDFGTYAFFVSLLLYTSIYAFLLLLDLFLTGPLMVAVLVVISLALSILVYYILERPVNIRGIKELFPRKKTIQGIKNFLFDNKLRRIKNFFSEREEVFTGMALIYIMLITSIVLCEAFSGISYKVTFQEIRYLDENNETCMIIIKPTGLASTADPLKLDVYIGCDEKRIKNLELKRIAKDIFVASFQISEFDPGVYFIEFRKLDFPFGFLETREVLLIIREECQEDFMLSILLSS